VVLGLVNIPTKQKKLLLLIYMEVAIGLFNPLPQIQLSAELEELCKHQFRWIKQ
jgi:hypothetical protein